MIAYLQEHGTLTVSAPTLVEIVSGFERERRAAELQAVLSGIASYTIPALDRESAELAGQIHGGVAQGVGQILMEQVVYEPESGQLLTASFMDYAMPRADTMCNVRIVSNPVPTPNNPLGVKGAGEAGCVGALPAVMIAIMNALAPLGVRELDMPATPERVWQAIQSARAGQ